MRANRSTLSLSMFLTVILVGSFLVAGCGDDGTITGTSTAPDVSTLVEDPLDGILDSTAGVTPAEPGPRIDRLAEALGLTEEQTAALAEAYAEFHDAVDVLKDQVRSGEITRDEAQATAAELREAFEAALQVILTPEQYDLLQEMRQNRDGRGEGRKNPIERWTEWLSEIGASEDQIDAVFAALDVLHDGLADLRAQIKDGTLTRDEAKAAAEELRAAFDAELQTILTAEQYEALLELRPDRPAPPAPPNQNRKR